MKKFTFVLLWMLTLSTSLFAQWSFDLPSVEAYIGDHKAQRSLLIARSSMEYGNKLLHEYSRDAMVDYKDINVELDKYTRAFDVIDMIYKSLQTVSTAKDTYTDVSEKLSGYREVLELFNEKIIKKNRYNVTDTLLLTVNYAAILQVASESESLVNSLGDLVLYVTDAAACSTENLMVIVDQINYSMNRIRTIVNAAYMQTWKHVHLRISYYKEKVYVTKTKQQIAQEAFSRWRAASKTKK